MTDLPHDITPAERERLERLTQRLEVGRPVPATEFRGDLGRAVTEEARRRRIRARPERLWSYVLALSAAGTTLLAVAATQL